MIAFGSTSNRSVHEEAFLASLPQAPNSSLGFFLAQAARKPLISVSYAHVDDEVFPAPRAWLDPWVAGLFAFEDVDRPSLHRPILRITL